MFGRPAGRLAGLAAGRAPPPGRPARTVSGLAAARPARTANSTRPTGPASTAHAARPPGSARTANPTRTAGPACATDTARAAGATYAASSTRPARIRQDGQHHQRPLVSPAARLRPAGLLDSRLAAHPGPIVAVGPPRLHVVADVDVIADIDVAVIDAAIPARIAGPGWRINRRTPNSNNCCSTARRPRYRRRSPGEARSLYRAGRLRWGHRSGHRRSTDRSAELKI